MNALADRMRSWQRWTLGIGPIVLAGLFLIRATVPVADPMLIAIFAVLAAGTAALIAGSRVGAGIVLALSLALFQPITAREFSFSLSAVDSDVWRAWAVAALVSLGWSIVAAVIVLVTGGRSSTASARKIGAAVAGGLVFGAALIGVFPMLAPQPAFGQELGTAEIDTLPVITMYDYGYSPTIVEATGDDEPYRARIDNPTELPHTFTIESLDLEVFVPAGRWAVLEIDVEKGLVQAPLAVICTIGDHLSLGMAGVVETR